MNTLMKAINKVLQRKAVLYYCHFYVLFKPWYMWQWWTVMTLMVTVSYILHRNVCVYFITVCSVRWSMQLPKIRFTVCVCLCVYVGCFRSAVFWSTESGERVFVLLDYCTVSTLEHLNKSLTLWSCIMSSIQSVERRVQ